MFEWLRVAGFAPKQAQRRLSQALRANSAQGHSHSGLHHHGDGNYIRINLSITEFRRLAT